MPKSVQKISTFQAVQKIQKNGPRCDLERIRDQRVEPRWCTFASQGPQGAAPSTRTRQKKEGERQKERRTKKERVRKVEKGTKGFEHASGQRPGEFILIVLKVRFKVPFLLVRVTLAILFFMICSLTVLLNSQTTARNPSS